MLTVEPFQEVDREDCLRIAAENYDRTMALNLDRDLSEMLSNSIYPPRLLVLKDGDDVRGFGCYTVSAMQYGVYEISWINVDRRHRGEGLGTFLVSRILEEVMAKRAQLVLLFASKAISLYERLGFSRLAQYGDDWLMALRNDSVPYRPFLA